MTQAAPGEETRRRRSWAAALAFVALSLSVLVAAPILVHRRVGALRAEIGVDLHPGVAPATILLTQLRLSLGQERSLARLHLATGDPAIGRAVRESRAAELRALAALQPIAERMGPGVRTGARALGREVALLHAALGRPRRGEADLPAASEAAFARALAAAERLQAEVSRKTRADRAAIREWETLGAGVTMGLSVLALAGASVVGWLTLQGERFARDAERALEQMQRVSAEKAQLLRGLSHDVKNPLGAADGYAELLEIGIGGALSPEQLRLVEGVRRSIRRSIAFVGDLVDLHRSESGELPIERGSVDVVALAALSATEHRGASIAAGHMLEVRLPDAALRVSTDAARVQEILDNLLSNAIKYTPPPGRITVGVCAEADATAESAVRIWVEDTGPGIPAELTEAVFDEFRRLPGSRADGHGLGLSISRHLARRLGGDLLAEHAAGGGARFTLLLPIRAG